MNEKLSDLILKGCAGTEQCFYSLSYEDSQGKILKTCAIGAAFVAAGMQNSVVSSLINQGLFLDREGEMFQAHELLIYMNDVCEFSREYCASVLQSLGY